MDLLEIAKINNSLDTVLSQANLIVQASRGFFNTNTSNEGPKVPAEIYEKTRSDLLTLLGQLNSTLEGPGEGITKFNKKENNSVILSKTAAESSTSTLSTANKKRAR